MARSLIELERTKEKLEYSDLLKTSEWLSKRNQVIKRDNTRCTKCGKEEFTPNFFDGYRSMTELENKIDFEEYEKRKLEILSKPPYLYIGQRAEKMVKKENYIEPDAIVLHVHHKYYVRNKYPWEYKLNSLITLCSNCHTYLHENENIIMYDNIYLDNPTVVIQCKKCNGTGHLKEYNYHMNGVCFECNGIGFS